LGPKLKQKRFSNQVVFPEGNLEGKNLLSPKFRRGITWLPEFKMPFQRGKLPAKIIVFWKKLAGFGKSPLINKAPPKNGISKPLSKCEKSLLV